MNIDKTKLSIQEQAALELYQQNEHLIQVADDIAAILQDMSSNDTDKKELKAITNLGAVLLDVRDKLGELNDKEAAEMPDFSTPIVSALEKLQKAFNIPAPVVNVDVPKIDAPQVTVDVPKLDLKGIENLLKKDIPQAFKDAIQSIPQVELPEPVDRWDEVLTWLESIDTASRMKPQAPNTLKVMNQDGSDVGEKTFAQKITISGSYTYIAKAIPGTAQSSAAWQVQKIDDSVVGTTLITWADGNANFDNIATDLTTLTYS